MATLSGSGVGEVAGLPLPLVGTGARSAPLGGVFGTFVLRIFPLPPLPDARYMKGRAVRLGIELWSCEKGARTTTTFSFPLLGLGFGGFADRENPITKRLKGGLCVLGGEEGSKLAWRCERGMGKRTVI